MNSGRHTTRYSHDLMHIKETGACKSLIHQLTLTKVHLSELTHHLKLKMAIECIDSSTYVSKILSDRRKAKKPLMEKMRRARINDSLNELKSLVLELLNKDASRYSKMEKADILEMTVGYLKAAQRQDMRIQDTNSLAEFRAGFNQCAAEVSKNLSASEGADHLREKLMSHLASNCHGNRVNSTFAPANFPANTTTTVWVSYPSPPPSPTSQNSVYLNGTAPKPKDSTILMCPTSPVQTIPQIKTKDLTKQPVITKKPALWRPW